MRDLRATNSLHALRGWRNEEYGVYVHDRAKALFAIERSASSLLGISRYGCHVNGYFVQRTDPARGRGEYAENGPSDLNGISPKFAPEWTTDPSRVMMWLGVRSLSKPTWPGMLDNMAAGGLTFGLNVMECARKECKEEASIPEALLDKLKPVSRLSYIFEDERRVCPQVEHCFDLEVTHHIVPVGADGEVDSFQLVSVAQVKEVILSEQSKSNSALVVLDFLYRHKFIDADSDPRHNDILSLMHVQFEFG
ncbi:unnamed protein product [Dicrocoelium dendriticum]|nr:unnamed protein product [Dicrocoelium dendriticum]